MSDLFFSYLIGAELGGCLGYAVGDIGKFSAKGTGAFFGGTLGGIIAYALYTKNSSWNNEWYQIICKNKIQNSSDEKLFFQTGNKIYIHDPKSSHKGIPAFKKVFHPTAEDEKDRWHVVISNIFTGIFALIHDTAMTNFKADCKKRMIEKCEVIVWSDALIGISLFSILSIVIIYGCFKISAIISNKFQEDKKDLGVILVVGSLHRQ